jgi:hypothetical protein
MPELLEHITAGYKAANAGYVHNGTRRSPKTVPVGKGTAMHLGLSQLLPHAIALLERNEGIPLAPRRHFASPADPDVLTVTSDASGHDGLGGWATLGADDNRPTVVSERWPEWAREALRQFKLPAHERTPGAPLLSMPAAELFTTWAVAEAAADATAPPSATAAPHARPKHARAAIAVGDCDPAADALDAASSGTPQMSSLLAATRARVKLWLGVSVPREWNVDADRLSHPHLLGDVLGDARAAGLSPAVALIPERCWRALRAATERATLA